MWLRGWRRVRIRLLTFEYKLGGSEGIGSVILIIIIYFDRFNPRANKEIKLEKTHCIFLTHTLSLSTTAPHPFPSLPRPHLSISSPSPPSSSSLPLLPPTNTPTLLPSNSTLSNPLSPSPTPHFTTTPHHTPSHPLPSRLLPQTGISTSRHPSILSIPQPDTYPAQRKPLPPRH